MPVDVVLAVNVPFTGHPAAASTHFCRTPWMGDRCLSLLATWAYGTGGRRLTTAIWERM